MVSDLGQEPKRHFLIRREVCGPLMGQMWAMSGPQSKTPTWWLAFTTPLVCIAPSVGHNSGIQWPHFGLIALEA
ncbi:MAG: hypothetical protein H7Z19_10680 [Chitinophagaceae bacterium]|nr:hypothetical protein [Rubrivivax sp.]